MKKILYISNLHDGTGYSNAAIGYALSLDAAGYDVVVRSIKLNNTNGEVPPRILELEKKSTEGCEIVIQHTLPHFMEYCGYFSKNIGLFVHETDSFGISPWPNYLNMIDQLIVPNSFMKKELCKNLTPPSFIVPHACDTSRYEKSHTKVPIPELNDKFVFYFIGENIRRKNLAGLLKAFHLEFTPNEPVTLLIKTSMPGLSPQDCGQKVAEFCSMIKQNMKLYKKMEDYHREIILTDFLTDDDILNLHFSSDCFVNLSYGESWSIPGFDAMAMGKPVISNDCGGPADFLRDDKNGYDCGYLIPNILNPCFGALETFGDLNTSNENWWEPDINIARLAMRQIYEDKGMREAFSQRGIDRAYDFSYSKVGEKFKEILQ